MSSSPGGQPSPRRIYWDSCVYLDYLLGEHELLSEMQAIVRHWAGGGVEMVTSALTIAEVLFVRPSGGG